MTASDFRIPDGLTTDGLLWKRYFARAIDSVILLAMLGLVGFLVGLVAGEQIWGGEIGLFLLVFFVSFLWIGYSALLESSPWQATLGKRIMGLRVYNAQGGPLGLTQAIARTLLKDGPFFLFELIPGSQLLRILWLGAHLVVIHRSPWSQAIHDRAVRSWVAAPQVQTLLKLS